MRAPSSVPGTSDVRQVLAAAAAAAARQGWPVFPCRPAGKRPAVPDHDAGHCRGRDLRCQRGHQGWEPRSTIDLGRIGRAWACAPYNVGIATGPAGLVVVDLDTAEHGGQLPAEWAAEPGVRDGQDVLAVLADRAGQPWPATYTVRTPSGGLHLYFRAIPGREIRNSTGRAGPMIDVRGAGGYIIGAGSIVRRRSYQLIDDRPPAALPPWLAELAVSPRPARPASRVHRGDDRAYGRLRGIVEAVLSSEPGTRNNRLYWAACKAGEMAAAGQVDRASTEQALVRAALEAGLRGGEAEARRTVASGLRQGAQ